MSTFAERLAQARADMPLSCDVAEAVHGLPAAEQASAWAAIHDPATCPEHVAAAVAVSISRVDRHLSGLCPCTSADTGGA